MVGGPTDRPPSHMHEDHASIRCPQCHEPSGEEAWVADGCHHVIHLYGVRLVQINPNACAAPTRLGAAAVLQMGAVDSLASIAKVLGAGWGPPASGGGDGKH
jgi:hypothetical protein